MSEPIVNATPATAPVINTPPQSVNPPEVTPDAAAQALAGKPVVKEPEKLQANKKKYNVRVDGKDEEVEIDLNNEDDLRKHLQMSKAAAKRMQESAEMKKGIQELIDTLRTDPLKVIGDPRLNISEEARQKLAKSIIDNEIQEMSKTPEQREKERLQKEYERLKAEVETEKKARETAEFAQLQAQQATQLDQEISSAIESSGLPQNARTVNYIVQALMFAMNNNLDLSAKDVIPYVKKELLSDFRSLIGSLPDDDFESWLGKDQIGRLRKRNLAKVKATLANPATDIKNSATPTQTEKPKEKIKMKDFFKPF